MASATDKVENKVANELTLTDVRALAQERASGFFPMFAPGHISQWEFAERLTLEAKREAERAAIQAITWATEPAPGQSARNSNSLLKAPFVNLAQLLSRDLSTRERTISYAKEFCQARIAYYTYIVDFFTTKSDAEIEEYFFTTLNYKLPSTDKARQWCKRVFFNNLDCYQNAFHQLEQNDIDTAYSIIHTQHAISLLEQEFSAEKLPISKNKANRWYEISYCQELVQALKPHTTYAEHYLKFSSISPGHFIADGTYSFAMAVDFPKYHKQLRESMERKIQFLNELIGDWTPFPLAFIKNTISPKTKAIFTAFQKSTDTHDSQKKPKGKQTVSTILVQNAKCLAELYTLEQEYGAFVDNLRNEHAGLLKLQAQAKQLEETLKQQYESYREVAYRISEACYVPKFEHVSDLKAKQDAFKDSAKSEILRVLAELQNLGRTIYGLLQTYNGDNLIEVTQAINEYTALLKQPPEILTLSLQYLGDSVNQFFAKLSAMNTKNKDDAKRAEDENNTKIAQHKADYQVRLQEHQRNSERGRKEKAALKLEEQEQRKRAALAKQQAQALEDKKRGEEAEQCARKLKDIRLNPDQCLLLDKIFSEHPPHYRISFSDITHLINALGGKMIRHGGSHQKMTLNVIALGEAFCTLEPNEDFDGKTAADKVVATPLSATLVRPHKPGHNPELLPQYSIKAIRAFLERVGFRWIVGQANHNRAASAAPPPPNGNANATASPAGTGPGKP